MANLDLKNPALQKVLLSVVVAGGLLAVFFLTHFLPFSYPTQRDQLGVLKADYEKKSTELARARATVADLPRFEAEYDQLHERWSLAAELLPADRELGSLLRRITLAGQQTGVRFVLFRPAAPKAEQYYTELPLQISVTGGYHQVGSFLAELANLRRIITVSNVRLKTNTGGDATASVAVEFTASAYSLNATTAAAPPETPAAGKEGASNARKSS
ncbi:MAG: type 4a pilus biogenesis protein PilO [Candidatus Eisenbacteria bacterium]|nr:type 4a pilus biogenesis protein PilO [Candidatus Eisenbacteria bacterium]